MSKYIDLVLVEHESSLKKCIFQAPAFSYLKKDDEVMVETCRGTAKAKVIDVISIDTENQQHTLDFIIESSGAYTPLKKVLCKIVHQNFEYENEGSEES